MSDVNMDITNPKLQQMVALCRREVPSFSIKYKDESSFMKFLNFFAKLFNPAFMQYTTTIGTTTWVPRADFAANPDGYVEVLAHEVMHMRDQQAQGSVLYFLRYFFPQVLVVLSLFSILAVWSLWFLLALVFLLALLPMPAAGRRNIELNGYTMSLAAVYWRTKSMTEDDFRHIADQFTGPAYYFMWPFRDSILKDLKLRAIKIRTEEVLRDPFFYAVSRIIRAS